MKKITGVKVKLLKYLKEHCGEVVDGSVLREITGGQTEWARRVRELRDEHGYDIRSHKDNTSLKQGQYILDSVIPKKVTTRELSQKLRSKVLSMYGGTCQLCGAGAGERYDDGKRVRIQVDHVVPLSRGGKNEISNLRTLCNRCNEGGENAMQHPVKTIEVLTTIRKANRHGQISALDTLIKKYPDDAKFLLKKMKK